MLDLDQRDVKYLPGVGPARAALLKGELQISTLQDLLYNFPYKYIDRSRVFLIKEIDGTMPYIQLKGKILGFEQIGEGRKKRLVAHFTDGTGVADLVWFSGMKFILDRYRPGVEYVVFGKPTIFGGRVNLAHPEIDPEANINLSEMGMQPYYNTTERMKKAGLNSAAIRKLVANLLSLIVEPLPETLPDWIREKEHLMNLTDALKVIHNPRTPLELRLAQLRLKFEELFYVQLNLARYASDRQRRFKGFVFARVGEKFNSFYNTKLPFSLTDAQKRVIREIRNDMGSGRQMNRLLQGDVGSGKTMVALMTMLIAIDNGYQACIMAPTEILSEQHYSNISRYIEGLGLRVELLTGSIKGKRRESVLQGLKDGSINILVSTHAVLEDPVEFYHLGFVVIDELPPGRKPIHTDHYYDGNHTAVYAFLERELKKGRQAYIVYPLIEESEKIDLKNLEDGYKIVCERFAGYSVSKVHGRMKPAEKDAEMLRFKNNDTQILVATTVIEVGVDVPNASIMVIENANRFGLSQLHQLRGRVGRGADQSFCLLITPYQLSEDTRKRIEIMTATCDGFEIAEADLRLRGPGDLEGTQQSGMAFDLKIANLARDGALIEHVREIAKQIVAGDPDLTNPENAIMARVLRRLKKSEYDWSSIS